MTTRRRIAFAGLFLAHALSLFAQNPALVLVQSELEVVRKVLRSDEDGSGLKGVSAAGRSVLLDELNVAVTVADDGQWGFRHLGTNRVMAYRVGAIGDRLCVEKALQSKSYNWLTESGGQLIRSQTLYARLTFEQGRTEVVSYFNKLDTSGDVAGPIKSYLMGELGDALALFPPTTRTEIVAADGANQILHRAAQQSEIDWSMIKNQMLAAKPGTGGSALPWLRHGVAAHSSLSSNKLLNTFGWTERSGTPGHKLFTLDLAPDYKVWLESPEIDGISNPNQLFHTTEGLKLLRSGAAKLYYPADNGGTIKLATPWQLLDPSTLPGKG